MPVSAMKLGSCCNCGITSPFVRNFIMLDRRAPEAGKGWGCVECGLPCDGAIAVLCDECFDGLGNKQDLKNAVVGYPSENRRIPFEQLTGSFHHDMSKHQDEPPFGEEMFGEEHEEN